MNTPSPRVLGVGDAFHYARFDNGTGGGMPTVSIERATVAALSPSGAIAVGTKAAGSGKARWKYTFHEVTSDDSAIPMSTRYAYSGTRGAYPTRQAVVDALRRGAEQSVERLADALAEARAWLESLPTE